MTATTGNYNVSATPRTKEQWDHWFAVIGSFIRDEEKAFDYSTGLGVPDEPPGFCPDCGAEVRRDYGTPWYYCPACDASWDEDELLREAPGGDRDAR